MDTTIVLQKLDARTYLVQYKGELKRVRTPRQLRMKDAVTMMRHAICKATRLNGSQFVHVTNQIFVDGSVRSYWAKVA